MTSQQLPQSPSLEHLRKQAKALLHAAHAQEDTALERFRQLPALSSKTPAELVAMRLALHDAQSVIAREYGFTSWKTLAEHVEERTLTFAAAIDEFIRCASGHLPERAGRLLALHPGIAHANLYTELLLGDASAVSARLERDPQAAQRPGGAQGWEPLLYVCHTCMHEGAPERATGLVATARLLLAQGANPNAQYDFKWHRELPRTALWAALCASDHPPLAQVLLENGANPTDGVSIHIAAGNGNLPALELLHRFGVNVDGIPGGVPPLRYILNWGSNETERLRAVRWLLEHGADPNLPWLEPGDAPLHVAAQRWGVPMVELLIKHGADIHQRRSDGRTAYTLAELQGNTDVAAWLLAHGAKDELSPLERFVAACARGDRAAANSQLQANPNLSRELLPEHHLALHVPAERGDAEILDMMLTFGFDANVKDTEGVTALHKAAMAGRSGTVRVLLAHGASINALDHMFSATPLVWAAEGRSWNNSSGAGVDHVSVARLLIASGSSLEWTPPEKAPHPEKGLEQLSALCRAAAQS